MPNPCICHMPCAICHVPFCVGSSICPIEIWSSLRCGGFLWGIMLPAVHHLLYAIRHMPFCNGLRHVPLRKLVLTSLRRLPHGQHVLRLIAVKTISRASCPPPTYRPLISILYSLIPNLYSLIPNL